MTRASQQLLFWTPRIIGILLALFVSVFALDVFSEGKEFWEILLALLMHLIPTMLVVVALAVSWKWEWIGGLLFIGLGLLHIYFKWGQLPWYDVMMIAGPAFLVGVLFLLNWRFRAELKKKPAV
jgi:hypothetical protein